MKLPYLIGITGGSGSGKTHFINLITTRFSESEVTLLSMDNYYKPIDEQQRDENGIENFDLPTAIDHKAFERDLVSLMEGKEVVIKEYGFNNQHADLKTIVLRPSPILLVEGIFAFHYPEILKRLDLKLFIESPDDLRVSRRIRRDAEERGYDRADVLYRFEHHVNPSYLKYTLPYKAKADLVVQNHENMQPAADLVCGFVAHAIG